MPTYPWKVAVLVGSLRKGSYSLTIANTIKIVAPGSMKFDFVALGDMPLYNQDLETDTPPAQWTAFRERIKVADAVLFVTPEYNRSVPAVLKNAIDVGSRPRGQNVWDGRPGAVVSVSPGALSAFGAHHHLRQTLVAVNVLTMSQPEAYIGNVKTLIESDGSSINEKTREFLAKLVAAFEQWIGKIKG